MSDFPTDKGTRAESTQESACERLTYDQHERYDDEIDVRELWNIAWKGKWRVIAVIFVFAIASVGYALLATEWYRAEVLLAPAEQKSGPSLGGQLGGLAALAGVGVGGGDSIEAVATLRSRDFAREFIEDRGLLTVFFADNWDQANSKWLVDDPRKQPDVRDAVRYFHENVLRVSEDRQTALVTLAVEWTDPEMAADWATALTDRLNHRLREHALRDAETNVEYLQLELARTNVVTLQQAIGRLLENELQRLMLARGNNEFAFKIIDTAEPPKERVRPRRALVVVLGTFLGGMFGLGWVLVAQFARSREPAR